MSDRGALVLAVVGIILSGLVVLLFTKLRAVHVLVNSRSQEQDDTIRALNAANETLTIANRNLERTIRALNNATNDVPHTDDPAV